MPTPARGCLRSGGLVREGQAGVAGAAPARDAKGRPPYMDRKRGKGAGARTLGQGRKKGGPMGRLFSLLADELFGSKALADALFSCKALADALLGSGSLGG